MVIALVFCESPCAPVTLHLEQYPFGRFQTASLTSFFIGSLVERFSTMRFDLNKEGWAPLLYANSQPLDERCRRRDVVDFAHVDIRA